MAGRTKKLVKIAYWDTEQPGATPGLIGQVQGTPTIKLIRPKTKKNKKNKKKVVLDYNGERKAVPLKAYVLDQLTYHGEKVDGTKGLDKFNEKAAKYGLPRILIFSKNAASPLLKYMTTEYRRKALFGLVKASKLNTDLFKKYGVKDVPAIIAIAPAKLSTIQGSETNMGEDGAVEVETPVVYSKTDKKGKIDITFGKLTLFLDKHVLREPATAPVDAAKGDSAEKPAKKEKTAKKEKKPKQQKTKKQKDEL